MVHCFFSGIKLSGSISFIIDGTPPDRFANGLQRFGNPTADIAE
jgi:hypothetical protein